MWLRLFRADPNSNVDKIELPGRTRFTRAGNEESGLYTVDDSIKQKELFDFWSGNPCDGQATLPARRDFRYQKEAWLLSELTKIGQRHANILEVGSGQGTDALAICAAMKPDGSYMGIDYSSGSVAAARQAVSEAGVLPVTPEFRTGDATRLPFGDETFEAVYSMGVLHHVADTEGALREVWRVTKTGGTVYIALYNSNSIKLRVAHGLRRLQRGLNRLFHSEACLLPLARVLPQERFGTMFIECFGVPVLKSYRQSEIDNLFTGFAIRRRIEIGHHQSFWFIEAQRV